MLYLRCAIVVMNVFVVMCRGLTLAERLALVNAFNLPPVTWAVVRSIAVVLLLLIHCLMLFPSVCGD